RSLVSWSTSTTTARMKTMRSPAIRSEKDIQYGLSSPSSRWCAVPNRFKLHLQCLHDSAEPFIGFEHVSGVLLCCRVELLQPFESLGPDLVGIFGEVLLHVGLDGVVLRT